MKWLIFRDENRRTKYFRANPADRFQLPIETNFTSLANKIPLRKANANHKYCHFKQNCSLSKNSFVQKRKKKLFLEWTPQMRNFWGL